MASPKIVPVTDAAFRRALGRGREAAEVSSAARAATYSKRHDTVVIRFRGGELLEIPRDRIPELAHLPAADLLHLTISPLGDAVRLDKHDVAIHVNGLISRTFGTTPFAQAAGKTGGSVRSPAKAAAARQNGAKGGRRRVKAS